MVTVSSVANASRGELLCITYEMLLEHIKASEESEGIEKERHITKAVDILKMLAGDLDFSFDISKDLFKIYVYVQGLLIKDKKANRLNEAYVLIDKLYQAFKVAAESEGKTSACMENAEVVYAGLTYGPNDINEITMSESNRGFKA